ncbi:fasciclin domain-containing protein [Pseudoroseomonas ludipueritiae]|uniref:Fasciclin domain-containing protein n=1 Tax=Pseudoroseomonas ludipueritiae TaxID=198093 RepID=A0ABR7R7F6_9PROT|nr:fasciclin domain-containing protein [Pseudoroseomonas ludipueritiae]MBC9177665.1 fasciclin domain-containing protein [Pseudoroseomonas ludipueritiae]MCG7361426.1 fasciclin domain-containing protein [Roseomonas sp. ACRSG]
MFHIPHLMRATLVAGLFLTAAGAAQAQNRNCIDTIAGLEGATRFVTVATRTHVAQDLREVGPYTIFVPTDAAINRVAPGLTSIVFPDDRGGTGAADPVMGPAVVNTHILEGRYTSSALKPGETVTTRTRAGTQLTISNDNGTFTITAPNGIKATVIAGDKLCSNGVVHVIDTALVR